MRSLCYQTSQSAIFIGSGCLKACLHCAIVSKGVCLQQNYNPNPIMQIKQQQLQISFRTGIQNAIRVVNVSQAHYL